MFQLHEGNKDIDRIPSKLQIHRNILPTSRARLQALNRLTLSYFEEQASFHADKRKCANIGVSSKRVIDSKSLMFEQKINKMNLRRKKSEGKSVTITVERLSDNSRITFTVSSEKSIEQLRAILNHHLPPHSPNRFFLHSHQRGALIHFHPPSFNLDYFPVIFDQSVLQLKMDDRNVNSLEINNEQAISKEIKKSRCSFIHRSLFPPSCDSSTGKSSTTKMTCLAILKRMFSRSFRPNNVHACCQADTFRH